MPCHLAKHENVFLTNFSNKPASDVQHNPHMMLLVKKCTKVDIMVKIRTSVRGQGYKYIDIIIYSYVN